ncbi:MAG: lipopolysaccharide heptosyltransferase I [Selenomonadaceae bacterium]|nr:lipopolysaccharide heptosyltransferase I [Selenomonadaceae bacterium]
MKNILIVKLSAIGDVIHALPVSYAVKETFPDAHLTWVVEPPAYDLLKMNPCVDEIIIFRKKEFKTLKGFIRNFFPFRGELQREKFDAVLDLQGLFKSAAIAFFAKSNVKLGICNMRELSDKISTPVVGENSRGHIVERYLDTARAIGCRVDKVVFPLEIPAEEIKKAAAIMEQAGLREGISYAAFVIGANWANKRWPTENFAQLSDWLSCKEIVPVLIGNGAVDLERAAEIETKTLIPPVNLINKTSLPQLAHVIKNASMVIGGDTGPVHLAAGLKVPTVMIMGPTDANRNGPYGQTQNALEVDRDCKACWKRACQKNLDCLENISVAAVTEKISAILKSR